MAEETVTSGQAPATSRKVGAALGIGIFVLPWVFAWFLLRKGYSNFARAAAFGWMIITVLIIAGGEQPASVATSASPAPTAPAAVAPPPAEEASSLTGPQRNAVRSANQYLSISGFSREGLIHQLSSSAGDGYDLADATAAVDSLDVDWNENAYRSAKQYLEMSGFSCSGLIHQLSSSAGDKYTESQATYGAKKAGAC